MIDDIGAFCPHGQFRLTGAGDGPLVGLAFAAKDLIDVAGHRTGAGNPRWFETHPPAAANASSVQKLLAAGAVLVGKTITDELAYSLNGDNMHYGTPRNVNAPGRVPGGSSSGSAAAVAASLCDFALGTDTGGSVRIPASYCGLYGIRTSHGRIAMDGVVPLMPSLDTLGWFARSPDLFAAVGAVLLPPRRTATPALRRLLVPDMTDLAAPDAVDALRPLVPRLARLFASLEMPVLAAETLEAWRLVFRQFSAAEAWRVHGEWIEKEKPVFAPAIQARFDWARWVADATAAAARRERQRIAQVIRDLLGDDGVLCLPTAPGPAPLIDAREEEVELFRQQAQRLTCIAGIAGLPQVTIPAGRGTGGPVGLSLIGPAGADEELLTLCRDLAGLMIGLV